MNTDDALQAQEVDAEIQLMVCLALDECRQRGVHQDAIDILAYASHASSEKPDFDSKRPME